MVRLLNEVQIFKLTRVNTAETGLSFLTNITDVYIEFGLSFATELESKHSEDQKAGWYLCLGVSLTAEHRCENVPSVVLHCLTASHRAPWVSR
jgi:hypothetical protein